MSDQESPAILRVKDVARLLGVAPESIRRYRKAGKFPAPITGLPGSPKWQRADVEAFMSGGKRAPEPHSAAELPPEFAFLAE